ncbi:MAG: ABC transporter ATP-binding protein [Lachnospiraceae bacterium]|nr:ABC transporter ATP-binding protein [Lachnospiraceae bacterium]
MKENMIEIRGLTKAYGEKIAVDHLNLSIRKGEVFGLLGPNGAGKTTTTLMLLGLTDPTSGQATIREKDCTRDPIDVKRMVGYLPDNVGFYTDMTGRENLYFTGRLNGLEKEEIERRADELLERVGMTEAADKKTGTYSRGMKQRLGIADVLMKDPEVIIMDEPTLGIDPQGMRDLLRLIRELAEQDGRTILISSHQLYQIQQVCDRVGIFVEGKLIACGTIRELGQRMERAGKYTLELAAEPDNEALMQLLGGMEGATSVERENDLILVRSGSDIRKKATLLLAANGYTVIQLRQKGGDLDEIYSRYFEQAEEGERAAATEREKKRAPRIFGKRA